MKIACRTHTLMGLIATSAVLLASGALSAWAHTDPVPEGTHPARQGMTVKLTTRPGPGGVLLRLRTSKFRWAPEHLSPIHGQGRSVPGEGHGHVYVDGSTMPAIMVVGPWTYLRLEPGRHTLRVTLNGNDHFEYRRNGHAIQDKQSVTVADTSNGG